MKFLYVLFFGLAMYGVIVGLHGAAIISAVSAVLLYAFDSHLEKSYTDTKSHFPDQKSKSDLDS